MKLLFILHLKPKIHMWIEVIEELQLTHLWINGISNDFQQKNSKFSQKNKYLNKTINRLSKLLPINLFFDKLINKLTCFSTNFKSKDM